MKLLVCLLCIGIYILLLAEITTGLTSIFSPLATSITPTSVDYSNVQSEKIVAQYINVTAISLLPSSNVDIVAEQSSLHQLLSSVIGSDLTTNIILSQPENDSLMTTSYFMMNSTFTPNDTLSTHSIEISPSIYNNESDSFLSITDTIENTMSTAINFTEMSSIPTTSSGIVVISSKTTSIVIGSSSDIEPIGSTSFDTSQTQISSIEYINISSIIDYSTSSVGPTRSPDKPPQEKSLSTAVIIVIVVLVILLAAVGIFCFRRRHKCIRYGRYSSAPYESFTDQGENEAININSMSL